MTRLDTSIRLQVILVTTTALLVLAVVLVTFGYTQQRSLLVDSERRVGLTLIRSVSNTINSVRAFIQNLSDISELDTRLAELVDLNTNIDFITITDADGSIIFHSNLDHKGSVVPELAGLPSDTTLQKTVPGYSEVFITSSSFDGDGLLASPHYQIIVASAAAPFTNRLMADVLSSVMVTVLFALVAAIIIIYVLQHYLVRPVEMLTHASEAIEAGDLTQQVSVNQDNEIGRLALSFNRMTQQLATLINTLEERVQERTRELEVARDQAEQASRAKSDFLSNMSHELRTPLNMVIGYTSSMLTMPKMYNNVALPEIYRTDVELIRDSGKHLLALINDILDLSKVEAGKLQLNFSAVDLNTSFDGVIAVTLGLIGDKPLQLQQNYPENLPKVWADSIRVRQILLNLLSNAVKYSETGSVTLTGEVRDNRVYISVTDTGFGIPESALSTIFDRFEQIQNNTEVQGTGLGLDISQRLAQLHGTEITIQSTLGVGSTFSFSLPVATPVQLQQYQDTTSSSGNSEVFGDDAALKIMALIVATDTPTRQQLRQMMEAQGVVVIEANDEQRALDLASGLLPDFIVLDNSLEPSAAQQLLAALQDDTETEAIPVISLENGTGPTTAEAVAVRATLRKPVVPDEMITVIKSLS